MNFLTLFLRTCRHQKKVQLEKTKCQIIFFVSNRHVTNADCDSTIVYGYRTLVPLHYFYCGTICKKFPNPLHPLFITVLRMSYCPPTDPPAPQAHLKYSQYSICSYTMVQQSAVFAPIPLFSLSLLSLESHLPGGVGSRDRISGKESAQTK